MLYNNSTNLVCRRPTPSSPFAFSLPHRAWYFFSWWRSELRSNCLPWTNV